jgi:hypothetical protein
VIPTAYESVPHQVVALPWPEAPAADLEQLVGAENVNATSSFTQVRDGNGDWVTLGNGSVVALDREGNRNIMSAGVLALKYRKADGG